MTVTKRTISSQNYAALTHRHRGVSLIELLIGLLIGLVLLGGVIQVYISNYQATRTISGFSAQQENSRVASHFLTQSLRLAGHYGSLKSSEINILGSIGISGVGNCNESWILDVDTPIRGYEGASSVAGVSQFPSNCIPNTSYVADSDILVLRYGSPTELTALSDLSSNKIYLRAAAFGGSLGGEILLGSNATNSQVGSVADLDVDGHLDAEGAGIYNYEYKTEVFFLRPCSELNGTQCNDGISTLVKYHLSETDFKIDAIAEGVEQFQIEYGEDTDNDKIANNWLSASNVSNWKNIMAVKIDLMIRSDQVDNLSNDTTTYNLVSGFNFTPSTTEKKYQRKLYSRVVQLRNLSRTYDE